jgi:hypothetical protein
MTRQKTEHLLIAGSLLLAPALALGQPEWVDDAREAAAGTAVFVIIFGAVAMLFGTLRLKFKRDLFARFIDKGQEIPWSVSRTRTANAAKRIERLICTGERWKSTRIVRARGRRSPTSAMASIDLLAR